MQLRSIKGQLPSQKYMDPSAPHLHVTNSNATPLLQVVPPPSVGNHLKLPSQDIAQQSKVSPKGKVLVSQSPRPGILGSTSVYDKVKNVIDKNANHQDSVVRYQQLIIRNNSTTFNIKNGQSKVQVMSGVGGPQTDVTQVSKDPSFSGAQKQGVQNHNKPSGGEQHSIMKKISIDHSVLDQQNQNLKQYINQQNNITNQSKLQKQNNRNDQQSSLILTNKISHKQPSQHSRYKQQNTDQKQDPNQAVIDTPQLKLKHKNVLGSAKHDLNSMSQNHNKRNSYFQLNVVTPDITKQTNQATNSNALPLVQHSIQDHSSLIKKPTTNTAQAHQRTDSHSQLIASSQTPLNPFQLKNPHHYAMQKALTGNNVVNSPKILSNQVSTTQIQQSNKDNLNLIVGQHITLLSDQNMKHANIQQVNNQQKGVNGGENINTIEQLQNGVQQQAPLSLTFEERNKNQAIRNQLQQDQDQSRNKTDQSQLAQQNSTQSHQKGSQLHKNVFKGQQSMNKLQQYQEYQQQYQAFKQQVWNQENMYKPGMRQQISNSAARKPYPVGANGGNLLQYPIESSSLEHYSSTQANSKKISRQMSPTVQQINQTRRNSLTEAHGIASPKNEQQLHHKTEQGRNYQSEQTANVVQNHSVNLNFKTPQLYNLAASKLPPGNNSLPYEDFSGVYDNLNHNLGGVQDIFQQVSIPSSSKNLMDEDQYINQLILNNLDDKNFLNKINKLILSDQAASSRGEQAPSLTDNDCYNFISQNQQHNQIKFVQSPGKFNHNDELGINNNNNIQSQNNNNNNQFQNSESSPHNYYLNMKQQQQQQFQHSNASHSGVQNALKSQNQTLQSSSNRLASLKNTPGSSQQVQAHSQSPSKLQQQQRQQQANQIDGTKKQASQYIQMENIYQRPAQSNGYHQMSNQQQQNIQQQLNSNKIQLLQKMNQTSSINNNGIQSANGNVQSSSKVVRQVGSSGSGINGKNPLGVQGTSQKGMLSDYNALNAMMQSNQQQINLQKLTSSQNKNDTAVMNAVKNINALMMNGKDGSGGVADSKDSNIGNTKRVSGHEMAGLQDANYIGSNTLHDSQKSSSNKNNSFINQQNKNISNNEALHNLIKGAASQQSHSNTAHLQSMNMPHATLLGGLNKSIGQGIIGGVLSTEQGTLGNNYIDSSQSSNLQVQSLLKATKSYKTKDSLRDLIGFNSNNTINASHNKTTNGAKNTPNGIMSQPEKVHMTPNRNVQPLSHHNNQQQQLHMSSRQQSKGNFNQSQGMSKSQGASNGNQQTSNNSRIKQHLTDEFPKTRAQVLNKDSQQATQNAQAALAQQQDQSQQQQTGSNNPNSINQSISRIKQHNKKIEQRKFEVSSAMVIQNIMMLSPKGGQQSNSNQAQQQQQSAQASQNSKKSTLVPNSGSNLPHPGNHQHMHMLNLNQKFASEPQQSLHQTSLQPVGNSGPGNNQQLQQNIQYIKDLYMNQNYQHNQSHASGQSQQAGAQLVKPGQQPRIQLNKSDLSLEQQIIFKKMMLDQEERWRAENIKNGNFNVIDDANRMPLTQELMAQKQSLKNFQLSMQKSILRQQKQVRTGEVNQLYNDNGQAKDGNNQQGVNQQQINEDEDLVQLFLGKKHRARIKQIYQQTQKIIENALHESNQSIGKANKMDSNGNYLDLNQLQQKELDEQNLAYHLQAVQEFDMYRMSSKTIEQQQDPKLQILENYYNSPPHLLNGQQMTQQSTAELLNNPLYYNLYHDSIENLTAAQIAALQNGQLNPQTLQENGLIQVPANQFYKGNAPNSQASHFNPNFHHMNQKKFIVNGQKAEQHQNHIRTSQLRLRKEQIDQEKQQVQQMLLQQQQQQQQQLMQHQQILQQATAQYSQNQQLTLQQQAMSGQNKTDRLYQYSQQMPKNRYQSSNVHNKQANQLSMQNPQQLQQSQNGMTNYILQNKQHTKRNSSVKIDKPLHHSKDEASTTTGGTTTVQNKQSTTTGGSQQSKEIPTPQQQNQSNQESELKNHQTGASGSQVQGDTQQDGNNKGNASATNNVQSENKDGQQAQNQVDKKPIPSYYNKYPPKRIPNPFDEQTKEQERFLQARKEAIQKYSKISANQMKIEQSGPLKFVAKEGNNISLIKRVMDYRLLANQSEEDQANSGTNNKVYWEQTQYYDNLYSFKWKPCSAGLKYDQISKYGQRQVVNHLQGHSQITTKDLLFINMKQYYEKINQNVYDVLPLTFVIDYDSEQLSEQIEQFYMVHNTIKNNLHFDNQELTQKLQESQKMQEKYVKTPYKLNYSDHEGKGLWLLKPVGLNRGIGIHVFESIDDLKNILRQHYNIHPTGSNLKDYHSSSTSKDASLNLQSSSQMPTNTSLTAKDGNNKEESNANIQQLQTLKDSSQQPSQNNQKAENQDKEESNAKSGQKDTISVQKITNKTFVIQKYVERPLLFDQRKFDIRVWVVLSHDCKLYQFAECYVRTSSQKYELNGDKKEDLAVHLTNVAVQKKYSNYGKYEEGNIVSFKTLCASLADDPHFSQGMSESQIDHKINKQMTEIIVDTVKAIKHKLVFQKYTFEFLGYDFIINEELGANLIEVNTNPSLEENCQLLKILLPRMVDDMFKLVLDPVFDKKINPLNNDSHTKEVYNTNVGGGSSNIGSNLINLNGQGQVINVPNMGYVGDKAISKFEVPDYPNNKSMFNMICDLLQQ